MTTQTTLGSVAHHIVGEYSQAGKLLVGAYGHGVRRLVNGANTGYVTLLNSGALPLVTDDLRTRLFKVQTQLTGYVEQGIDSGTERAEQAIDFVAGGVDGGIRRVAAATGRIEEVLDTKALSEVGRIAILPVARVSLTIAQRTAQGTKRLSERVAGGPAPVARKVAEKATKAKRVVKKAVRRTRASA